MSIIKNIQSLHKIVSFLDFYIETRKTMATESDMKHDGIMAPPAFTKLRESIESQAKKRKSLQETASLLSQEEAFDESDLTAVNQLLLDVVKEEERLREILSTRQKIYEEQLRGVQATLHSRNKALERINSQSDTFEHFPELAKLFAAKQIQLSKQVTTIKCQLESDWS